MVCRRIQRGQDPLEMGFCEAMLLIWFLSHCLFASSSELALMFRRMPASPHMWHIRILQPCCNPIGQVCFLRRVVVGVVAMPITGIYGYFGRFRVNKGIPYDFRVF